MHCQIGLLRKAKVLPYYRENNKIKLLKIHRKTFSTFDFCSNFEILFSGIFEKYQKTKRSSKKMHAEK